MAVKAGYLPEGTKRQAGLHRDGWHDRHLHAQVADNRIGRSGRYASPARHMTTESGS